MAGDRYCSELDFFCCRISNLAGSGIFLRDNYVD
jgi:hypothetical protein